ncbi:MAG: hypothetical protein ABR600_00050 [Actinomycetota bacterium]
MGIARNLAARPGYAVAVGLLLLMGSSALAGFAGGIGLLGLGIALALMSPVMHTRRALASVLTGVIAFMAAYLLLARTSCLTRPSGPGHGSSTVCRSGLGPVIDGLELPDFVWAVGAVIVALTAGWIVWTLSLQLNGAPRRPTGRGDGLLWLVTGGLLGFSFIAMFSIGLLTLPFGLALITHLLSRKSAATEPGPARASGSGPFLIGMGGAVLPFVLHVAHRACQHEVGSCTQGHGCVERCLSYAPLDLSAYMFPAGALGAVIVGTVLVARGLRTGRSGHPAGG